MRHVPNILTHIPNILTHIPNGLLFRYFVCFLSIKLQLLLLVTFDNQLDDLSLRRETRSCRGSMVGMFGLKPAGGGLELSKSLWR